MKCPLWSLCALLLPLVTPSRWCAYEEEETVECRVRNGSEFYMSRTPLCTSQNNGSMTCMQRVLMRPKFITALKNVTHTRYKCCPPFSGSTCHIECFNCSSFQKLEERLHVLETKSLEVDQLSPPSVEQPSNPPEDDSLRTTGLDKTIRRILTNLRNLDFRLEKVERDLGRMMSLVQRSSLGPEYQILQGGGRRDTKEEDVLLSSFKILENNLGRGDIASTLNDDYGEDNLSPSPTGLDYEEQLSPKD